MGEINVKSFISDVFTNSKADTCQTSAQSFNYKKLINRT